MWSTWSVTMRKPLVANVKSEVCKYMINEFLALDTLTYKVYGAYSMMK